MPRHELMVHPVKNGGAARPGHRSPSAGPEDASPESERDPRSARLPGETPGIGG